MKRRWLGPVLLVVGLLVGTTTACAAALPVAEMSASPATYTPQIPLGGANAVYAMDEVVTPAGPIMYAGGHFASISGVPRQNAAAFSATTGKITGFYPKIDGEVWAIAGLPNGLLAIGGTFNHVGGQPRTGLAVVNATTGDLVPSFNAHLNGPVTALSYTGGRLIAGGRFSKLLAAFNPATGIDTNYLNLGIVGVQVYHFAVNPLGTRLLAIANVSTVKGVRRSQAFMVNLGPAVGTLSPWFYPQLLKGCRGGEPMYLRGVAFSPDGSYFVLDSTGYVSLGGGPTNTGGDIGLTICDAAARFETNVMSPSKPTWINITGGDTLHSVAISTTAVYVAGHQRWLDNPHGRDTKGLGGVDRPGIGALDPATGKALTWNPTRTRGVGARVLLLTPEGLWVGSDTQYGGSLGCASPGGVNHDDCWGQQSEVHAGIGLLPRR